jgi:predicted ATPase
MSTKARGHVGIMNGPSKFDLMVSLFTTVPVRVPVLFKTENHGDFSAIITGVRWEDGSGESWIIEGYSVFAAGARFTGYFSTKDRRGHIKFLP